MSTDVISQYEQAFRAATADFMKVERQEAWERFAASGFPHSNEEEWRQTSLRPIAEESFDWSTAPPAAQVPDGGPLSLEGCHSLVLLNGRRVSSEPLPEGVTLLSANAERLGVCLDQGRYRFADLNTALLEDGVAIRVPAGTVLTEPIHVQMVTAGDSPRASFPRLLIDAGENSEVTVIESHHTLGAEGHFGCAVTEIAAADNARVDHYRLQYQDHSSRHVGVEAVRLGRTAQVSSLFLSFGAALSRNDVHACLEGEGGTCTLDGLYVAGGRQHVDHHMRVEHKEPNTFSHELFKGILDDRARSVFNGRIYVHQAAQKTDAKQTNRNLILSDTAIAHSNPQLEIFADDVRCTHGSTIGQMDEEALFYLQSRGVPAASAMSLLTYAFVAELTNRIRVPALREVVDNHLFSRLPGGELIRDVG